MIAIKIQDAEIPTIVMVETQGKTQKEIMQEIVTNTENTQGPISIYADKNIPWIYSLLEYCIDSNIELATV